MGHTDKETPLEDQGRELYDGIYKPQNAKDSSRPPPARGQSLPHSPEREPALLCHILPASRPRDGKILVLWSCSLWSLGVETSKMIS